MARNYTDYFSEYFTPYNDDYYTQYNIIDGGIADEGIYYNMALDDYAHEFDGILKHLFLYFYNIKPVLLKCELIRKLNNNEYVEGTILYQLIYVVTRFIKTQNTYKFPQILIEDDLRRNYKIYFHQDLSEIFLLFFLFLIAKLKIINNETDYIEETFRLLVSNISSMPEDYPTDQMGIDRYLDLYRWGYIDYNPFIEAHMRLCSIYYYPNLVYRDTLEEDFSVYDHWYNVIYKWNNFTNNLTIDEIKTKVINLIYDEFNIRLNETDIKKIKKSTIAENLIKNYYRYYEKYDLILIDGRAERQLSNFNYNNGYMSFPWSLTQTYFKDYTITPIYYYTTDYNVNINPGPWEKDYLKQHYNDTINVDTAYGFPTSGYYLNIRNIGEDYYLIGTDSNTNVTYRFPAVSYEEHKSNVIPNCKIKNLTRNKFTLYYYEDYFHNVDFSYLIDISIFTPLFYKNAKCSYHIGRVSGNFSEFLSHFERSKNLNNQFYTEEIKEEIYKFRDRIICKKVFVTEYTYTDTMENIIPKDYIKRNKMSLVDMGKVLKDVKATTDPYAPSKKGYATYGNDQKYNVNRGYYGSPYDVNEGMRINTEFNEQSRENLLLYFRRPDLNIQKISSYRESSSWGRHYVEENNEINWTYNDGTTKYSLGKGNIYKITNFNKNEDIVYYTPQGGTSRYETICPYYITFFSTRFPKVDYEYWVYKDEEIHEYLKVMYLYILLATTFNSLGEATSGTNITNYDIDLQQQNRSDFGRHLLTFWVNNFKNKTINEIKEYLFEYIRQNTIILNTNINLDFNTLNNTIFNKVINNYVIYENDLTNWINYTEIDSIKNYQIEPYYSFF